MSSMLAEIVQCIETYLSSLHMLAHRQWISGCADYFLQENLTILEIKENAYNQWLLNDLRYICPGCLPDNLAQVEKTVLDGCYVLQINRALDISVPAYQQYLKMKKTDEANIKATMNPEEKISSKRMLKFELTDGKQILAGIEYETLTKIKAEDIVPGCKVSITGPVQCRKGMLLLTNSVIECLAGEVEDMLLTHSLAAQLASKLNLPLIENASAESTDIGHMVNGDILCEADENIGRQNGVAGREIPSSNETITRSKPGSSNNNESIDAFGKRQLEVEGGPQKKLKLEVFSINDDEEIWAENMLAIEQCEQLHSAKAQVAIPSEPFVYIKQIKELSELDKCGRVFRVKAQIHSITTKLTLSANREWNLKCKITDGSGSMEVEFSSEILSQFLGYTPEDISDLKKRVNTSPEIKNDINAAYAKTAQSLKTLYCIMELTMSDLPKIIRLIDFDYSHIDLLRERLKPWI